jgi:hypothetical protein
MVREVLEEGRRRGELRADMDIDLQADILYAPIYLRLLMQHQPLDRSFADMLSTTLMKLIAEAPPEVKKKARGARA